MAEPFEYNFTEVLRLVRRLLSKEFDHESITQEILFECWKNNQKASYGFIRNRCFDCLRRRKLEDGNRPSGEGHTRDSRQTGDLENAISGLTPEEKRIIWYRFWKGETFEEIALLTGWSKATVTSIYYDALGKLEEQLGETEQ
jgi:RNA polymerase sigma-70 factor (ECF subfamily)